MAGIVELIRRVMLDSDWKDPETKEQHRCKYIVLRPTVAEQFEEEMGGISRKPLAGLVFPERPIVEAWQKVICNFDGAWLIEDENATQPITVYPQIPFKKKRVGQCPPTATP